MNLSLRLATTVELDLLAKFNHALIRDEGHRNRMTLPQLRDRLAHWLATDYQAYLFELQTDTGPIGYTLFRTDPECLYIRQFFIVPEYRRRGHGRQAFEQMRKNVWLSNLPLRLDVLVHNHTGIKFWHALGFADYCLTLELPAVHDLPSEQHP